MVPFRVSIFIFYLLLYRQEAASARTVPQPGSRASGQLGLSSGVVPLALPFEVPDVLPAAPSCPSNFPVAGLVPPRPLNGTPNTARKTVEVSRVVN